ncbi:MAG: hypothetical protein WC333_07370 [Dehalococcoidia bacterium]
MAGFKKGKETCERFIAYFDIMGFKDRVYRDYHDDILEMMETLQQEVELIRTAGELAVTYESLSVDGSFKDVAPTLKILPVFFSDSIILASEDDSNDCAMGIVTLSARLLKEALSSGIPLKGAVSFGRQTADFDKSIHFGRPLVDAYILAEELQFYGVVLHHSMEGYLKQHGLIRPMVDINTLYECKVPFKGYTVNHYCLNWTKAFKGDSAKPKEILSQLYDTVSGSTRHYVDNTMDFVRAVEANKTKK